MPASSNPVWFITGCSTGFGRELARLVLERGWRAVVTARDESRVADFAKDFPETALPIALDVTDQKQIAAAVKEAQERFGTIDVLVNNAGYGYQSTVEEGDETEIRALFDANVFGLFAMTRAVLPVMRAQGSGHIVNITSLAGLAGFAGSGYYAASKHAVEGFSDSLFTECTPLGIRVTCVEPGPFRTDWAGRSLRQTKSRIAAYSDTAAARMKGTSEGSGKQAGDPALAAEAMIAITQSATPPRNIALGERSITLGLQRLKQKISDIEAWKTAGLETDSPSSD